MALFPSAIEELPLTETERAGVKRVSIQEIMSTLDIGRDAAYALVNSGQLKSIRIGGTGGRKIVLRSHWDRFLAGEMTP